VIPATHKSALKYWTQNKVPFVVSVSNVSGLPDYGPADFFFFSDLISFIRCWQADAGADNPVLRQHLFTAPELLP
jgi:hypothetical protein